MNEETHSSTNNDDLFGSSGATTTEALEQDPGAETSGEEVEEAVDAPETEETTEGEGQEAEPPQEANEEVLKILVKKGISEDKFNEYLKRYDVTAQEVNEKPKLAQLLLDKAASDELIAKTPKEEAKKEEVKQDPPDLEKHLADLKQSVSQYTDPAVRSAFVKQINEAKTAEEQFDVLTLAATNLVNTIMEKRFGEVFTNYTTTQQRDNDQRIAAHNAAWEPQVAKNANLPKDALAAYEEARKLSPKLVDNMKLNAEERMETVALVLGGRKAEAEAVAKAAEKGKEAGAKAERKAGLGKLGAGQSTAAIAKKTAGKNDDVFGALDENPINQRLTGQYK